jgi:purine-cytosine permease-like protein
LSDLVILIIGFLIGAVITAVVSVTGDDNGKGFYETRRRRRKKQKTRE